MALTPGQPVKLAAIDAGEVLQAVQTAKAIECRGEVRHDERSGEDAWRSHSAFFGHSSQMRCTVGAEKESAMAATDNLAKCFTVGRILGNGLAEAMILAGPVIDC